MISRKSNGVDIMRKCYICKEKRPEDKISVCQKRLFFNGLYMGNMIMMHCNDNPDCIDIVHAAMAEGESRELAQLAVQGEQY
jgi:hypothetical protein